MVPLLLALLPTAGAAHGGDVLVEVAAAFQVLLDGAVAVPGVHFHRSTAALNAVSVGVVVACGRQHFHGSTKALFHRLRELAPAPLPLLTAGLSSRNLGFKLNSCQSQTMVHGT